MSEPLSRRYPLRSRGPAVWTPRGYMLAEIKSHAAYQALRADVAAALVAREDSSKGGRPMALKSIFLLTHWMFWYASALTLGHFEPWLAVLVAPVAAASFTVIMLCITHEGVHSAASEARWVNRLASSTLVMAGASAIGWQHEHVTGHHPNTNVLGLDPDLDTSGILRFHEGQPWRPLHRYQHLYAWFVYAIVSLRWIWYEDFDDIGNDRHQLRGPARRRHIADVLLSKLLHAGLFIALPIGVLGFVPALVFYVVHFVVNSLLMATVFVVNHTTGQEAMPLSPDELPNDWGLAQLVTTANFAGDSRAVTWLVGGLNLQIEHHLFPGYSHRHYRWIRGIVRSWAEKHGVRYVEHPTFLAALSAHRAHLQRLGRPPLTAV